MSDIQVGDKVTWFWNNETPKREITEIITKKNMIENLLSEKLITIVKIERPHYEVIEEKKELLTEEEKEYLSNVIKPFRSKVNYIERLYNSKKNDWILIYLLNDNNCKLPHLKDFNNLKFKGLIENKKYTLQELGL